MDDKEKLHQIRGIIIDKTNQIETIISEAIYLYFRPQKNQYQFRHLFLDSLNLNLGAKLKIIYSLGIVNGSEKELLHKLIGLRNIFAHAPTYLSKNWKAENEESEYLEFVNSEYVIPVLKKGDIEYLNPDDLYSEFEQALMKIQPTLEKIISTS